jgi:hypothetical protein
MHVTGQSVGKIPVVPVPVKIEGRPRQCYHVPKPLTLLEIRGSTRHVRAITMGGEEQNARGGSLSWASREPPTSIAASARFIAWGRLVIWPTVSFSNASRPTAAREPSSRLRVAIKQPSGEFEWREVIVGLSDGARIEVKEGIRAGDVVLVNPWNQMIKEPRFPVSRTPTAPVGEGTPKE